jgi:hypothetical protein
MEVVIDHATIGHDVPMAYRMATSVELAMYETAMYKELKQYSQLTPDDIYEVRRKVDRLPSKEHVSRMTRGFTKQDWKFMKRILMSHQGPIQRSSIEKMDKATLYVDWQFHILAQTTIRWRDDGVVPWSTFTHYEK